MPPPGLPEGLPGPKSPKKEETTPKKEDTETVVEEPVVEESNEASEAETEASETTESEAEPTEAETTEVETAKVESTEETPETAAEDTETPQDEPQEEPQAEETPEMETTEAEAVDATVEEEPTESTKVATAPAVSNRAKAAEKEVIKLSNEVHSLRKSLAGAADVIEDLETQPMPPAVLASDIVVPDHLVADIARLARQLDREQLVRANMGTISMLHPGMPGVMISTKAGTTLSRLNERGIVGGRLGQGAPQGAPSDWRVLEVLLAATSLETGGPAACLHMMGAYTTAASCEKDLILCSPIDEVGKKMLGKIVIVDPDEENPDDFLRQTAEALKMGGSKCVVIRGHGAYCVGADLDDAWANAAMLEHSMKIVLLARQANLKI